MKLTEFLNDTKGYSPWYNPIDFEVANEEVCEKHPTEHLHFIGRQHAGSYRAFAFCPICNEGEEF